MRLFELFDDTYETKIIDDGYDLIRIQFETDDGEVITIEFDKFHDENIFDVNFQGIKGFALSGDSENPYKVFATIIKEIRHFMNRDDVNGIAFTINKGDQNRDWRANKAYDSRTKLYNQLLRRFAKNYDIEVKTGKFRDYYIVKERR